jgi:hypothetical protein
MSNSIFDLEQEMLQFANVTDDIERVTKYLVDDSDGYTDDDVMNKYFAIKELYEIKFENMWHTFEQVCKEYHIAHKLAGLERDEELQRLFDGEDHY